MPEAITPNWLAYIVLLSWPLVAIVLYSSLPRAQAMLWTVLGAQMLLPANMFIKFPMIPPFDKNTIPSLCILAGCLLTRGRQLRIFYGSGLVGILIVANLISPVL